jgi:PAS domain S-box-containing protein
MVSGWKRPSGTWWWWAAVFTALTGVAVLGANWYSGRLRCEARLREGASLAAIADLKAGQIARWRAEHTADLNVIAADAAAAETVRRFLATGRPADRDRLLRWLANLRREWECRSTAILDATQTIRLASGDEEQQPGEHTRRQSREVFETGEPRVSDLHRGTKVTEIHTDLIAPLMADTETGRVAAACLLLRVDPRRWLFPMLQAWPQPSESGEILLVRRDGDDALLLNDTRHAPGAALRLRLPLAAKSAATQALLGRTGSFETADYRGVPVLAAAVWVPESPWCLLATKELSEIDAGLHGEKRLLRLMTAGLALLFGTALFGLWWRERYRSDAERLALERHYEMWLRHANDIILLTDSAGAVVEANERALRTYGYAPAQILRRNVSDLEPDAATPEPTAAGVVYETEHRCADGRTFPAEVSARRIEAQGRTYRQYIVRDIAERRRIESDRAAWRTRYEMAAAVAGQVTYEFDVATEATQWGGSVRQVFGYALEEMAGAAGLVHPEDRAEVQRQFREITRTHAPHDFEYRFRHKDGRHVLVRDQGISLQGADGAWRIVGLLTDISERRRTEAALQRSEERYRLLFERMREGFALHEIVCDEAGRPTDYRFLEVNPAFEKMIGRSARDLIGRTVREVMPDVEPHWIATYGRVALTGEPATIEEFAGTLQRFYSAAAFSPAPGQFAVVVEDVTERRALEARFRQSQKFDAIGRLAGGVAHDFNNILTAILGCSELLLARDDLPAEARESVEEVRRTGQRAAALTRQLLAFSSRQPAHPRALDLNRIVADMEPMLRRLIGEHIRLETELAPRLRCVRADPSQIEQILLNLSVNSRDAMPGGGTIRIGTADVVARDPGAPPDTAEKPHVRLTVGDTGCGMSREVRAHLFEPFFTTKGAGKGVGLGLATVYGIVRQSGGHIVVDSEVGQGTRVHVFLPRDSSATATSPVPDGAAARAPVPGGSETVLVVEDEPIVRQLAVATLRRAGYRVREAEDGEQALHAADEIGLERVDLLFTDVVMPGLDGRALAARLRARRPGLRVLYASGYVGDLPAGAGGEPDAPLLAKPYTPADLARRVRRVLDGHDAG